VTPANYTVAWRWSSTRLKRPRWPLTLCDVMDDVMYYHSPPMGRLPWCHTCIPGTCFGQSSTCIFDFLQCFLVNLTNIRRNIVQWLIWKTFLQIFFHPNLRLRVNGCWWWS
jgi:hypothetical protein